MRIRDAHADIQFLGDSVHLNRLVASRPADQPGRSRGCADGSLSATARIRDFDLDLFANNFAAISNARRYRGAHAIGAEGLQGALQGSSLSGRVEVNEGVVYIPELVSKDVISLDDPSVVQLIDTTLFTNRSLLPRAPPTLVRNLTIQGVRIVVGDDVWLRSREANIKLAGSLEVTKGTLLGTAAPQLALEGVLETERGTYVLELAGVVRRLFEVESGTLRFFGEPELQSHAQHPSRAHRRGVRRRGTAQRSAHPRGPGRNARAARHPPGKRRRFALLRVRPAQSTGHGRAELAARSHGIQRLSLDLPRALHEPANRTTERALPLDLFQIRSGVAGGTTGSGGSPFGDLLRGSSLGIGKQVGERSFLSLSYGLCALAPQTTSLNLAETLGLRFEHRLQAGFGFSVSREPASQNATCGIGGRTFTATPPQYGLDLFRAWRY